MNSWELFGLFEGVFLLLIWAISQQPPHIFNAVRDTVRMLQEGREQIPLFGGKTPYCSTLFKYTKESFSAENPMAALKHYGPTALSMTAAGLFSAYTMDHSPEMAILHVVLVGTSVKSLDILLGSLTLQRFCLIKTLPSV